MAEVQVHQSNRCNEDGERPANQHRGELGKQHHDRVHKEDVVTEDEVHHAFVHEPGIWIEHGADEGKQNHLVGDRFSRVAREEENECRKDQTEHEMAEVVSAREATKRFDEERVHKYC